MVDWEKFSCHNCRHMLIKRKSTIRPSFQRELRDLCVVTFACLNAKLSTMAAMPKIVRQMSDCRIIEISVWKCDDSVIDRNPMNQFFHQTLLYTSHIRDILFLIWPIASFLHRQTTTRQNNLHVAASGIQSWLTSVIGACISQIRANVNSIQ